MRLRRDGSVLRDEHGRQRVLHGVNLVAKGERGVSDDIARFFGAWTVADLTGLVDQGLTVVRLGVIWAAVEPRPGCYDERYLAWIGRQLDLCHQVGLTAFLDAHQDLYSQEFGDGAPGWATLTDAAFEPAELWSEGYLSSCAVQQALDAFWANAPAADGIGIQDRFVAMWRMLATRFGHHPALIGYDLLNEPAPGRTAPDFFAHLIAALAEETGLDAGELLDDFADPVRRLQRLSLFDDAGRHRRVGDKLAAAQAEFDASAIAPLTAKVVAAIRAVDPSTLILREHGYFANSGVPSGVLPPPTEAWAYAPHGYDLTVDVDGPASSDVRAHTIFERIRESQRVLGVPVLVGEWGGFGRATGIARHARHLLDLFDLWQWSSTYWCWEPGFAQTEAAAVLVRPRPLAIAGRAIGWRATDSSFTVRWEGMEATAPSEFWLPPGWGTAVVARDGTSSVVERTGERLTVEAGPGRFDLLVRRVGDRERLA